MKKRFVSILIIVVLLMTQNSVTAFALDQNPIDEESKSAYYTSAYANLSISASGVATTKGIVVGKPNNTTKIVIHLYLQKYSGGKWNTYKDWTGEKKSHTYTFSKNPSVGHGKYRTKAICTVYSGAAYEKVTKYSGTVSY